MKKSILAGIAMGLLLTVSCMNADDWPQWRGPARTGVSQETGLLTSWPDGGPKELWSIETAGEGFAGVAVVGADVFLTGSIDGEKSREGILYCLSAKDGGIKWESNYGPEWKGSYSMSRSTPSVEDGRVYIRSGMGQVVCYDAKTGAQIWSVDTMSKFGGKNITWGIAESLLILDGKVICHPGGTDSAVAALDKFTGATVWATKGLSDKSAYCSAFSIERGGKNVILTQTSENIIGVDAATGKVLWQFPHRNKYSVHPNTPVVIGSKMFISSGYGYGSELIELSPDATSAKVLWKKKDMDNHFQGMVYHDGLIYGSGSRGGLMGIVPADGSVAYKVDGVKKAAILMAEGHIYAYDEKGGTVSLVKVSKDGSSVQGTVTIGVGNGPHWAHPALANGALYIRHGKALVAYNVKAAK